MIVCSAAIAIQLLSAGAASAASPTPAAPAEAGLRKASPSGAPSAVLAAPPTRSTASAPSPPAMGVLRPVSSVPAATPGSSSERSSPTTVSTATPSPTPEAPTETPTPTATAIELPALIPSTDAVRGHVDGTRLLLEVPIRTQFDGTEFQASNCGPASLAMVLDAFGVSSKTFQVRNLINARSGDFVREDGTALDHLGWVATQAGLRTVDLYEAGGYRRWTTAAVRDEVRRGHPVITLVRLRALPYFAGTSSPSEHYIVVVGLDGGDFLVNDAAMPGSTGYRLPLTPPQLEQAWAASSIPGQSVAFAAGERVPELLLADPLPPSPTPGEVTLTAAPPTAVHVDSASLAGKTPVGTSADAGPPAGFDAPTVSPSNPDQAAQPAGPAPDVVGLPTAGPNSIAPPAPAPRARTIRIGGPSGLAGWLVRIQGFRVPVQPRTPWSPSPAWCPGAVVPAPRWVNPLDGLSLLAGPSHDATSRAAGIPLTGAGHA